MCCTGDLYGIFYSFVFNYCSELVDTGASDTGRHVAEADSPRPDESFSQQKSTLVIEFYPGSIHSEDVRAFWQNDLQAGEWVMDVLTQGYVIPFVESPPAYEEANNKSAMQDMPFVIQAVAELQKRGVIEFRDEKPLCVSPLTVSKKFGRDGITKNRLCWDGSRCVNLYVKEQKVVLSHLRRSLEITREGDFQVTYDLKAAYHHVRIHPSQTKYLGAAIPKPDGGKQYFVFLYLPFGLSSAVHCLTKLFKPVNAYIHEKGIRHSIYLDDGRIVAETKCKAEDQRTFVYKVLKSSGWILEVEKSDKDGDANQSKEYLGFYYRHCQHDSPSSGNQETTHTTTSFGDDLTRIEIVPSQRISRDYRENSSNGTGTRADSCNSSQGFLRSFRGGHTTERMEFVVGDE